MMDKKYFKVRLEFDQAMILAKNHSEDIDYYPETDIFDKYSASGKYRQCFLGNAPKVLASLKENLVAKHDPKIAQRFLRTLFDNAVL